MSEGLTHEQALEIFKVFLGKWAELVCKEIEKDIARFESLDPVDQIYLHAFWKKTIDAHMAVSEEVPKTSNRDEQWPLILEVFGDQIGAPAEKLELDVAHRLKWYKRKIAQDFERDVKSSINLHSVTSPIEQIFLMEWKLTKMDDRFGVKIEPQKPIITPKGTYQVDFLIRYSKKGTDVKVAIECDGHDFHEKTKLQVVRDKSRERAIVSSGITVLRFSGSEIFNNARRHVQEVAEFLEGAKSLPVKP